MSQHDYQSDAVPPYLTVRAIADATELSIATVETLLTDDFRRGIVVRVDDGWRLSDAAEEIFGSALRSVGDVDERTYGLPARVRARPRSRAA